MQSIYFISFLLAALISFALTFWVIKIAKARQIVDLPDTERRFHNKATPTLGGMAVFGSFLLVTVGLGIFGGYLLDGNIPIKVLLGIWGSGVILMIGGFLDDKYRLPAKHSIIFPILAALVIVLAGVKAVSVHNPLDGSVVILMPFVSGLVVFLWTMTLTYTTKILDGMDGLVAGISAIGALILFGLSLSPQVQQPGTAFLSITLAGSFFGFLILNFYPARIFLGEGGSTFAGFMLAVLAVVSGGKIATALLVMGIPLLDMVWVVLQRVISGSSPFKGDRKHLHYILTEIGFSQRQAVLTLYAITGIFGISALFLQSTGKLVALGILILVMLGIIVSLFSVYRKGIRNNE